MTEPITYQLQAPEQKRWNATSGVYEQVPPYTSARPIWGVKIIDGAGETQDPLIAREFYDMGYTVTPDPHEAAKAAQAKKEATRKKAKSE